MVAWAEARRGTPLRWWQWLCAQRRYEIRADGTWCWLLGFESTARQQGKSVDIAEDAAWMCSIAEATPSGESFEVLHAAHRVRTSLKVQAELWAWAEGAGLQVRRLLGDSQIVWPDAVWATVAMESVYGRRPSRLLADEAWAMDPVKFWNSMFPSLGDKENPQAWFLSAANIAEKGLVADLRSDGRTCRMEWGVMEGEDRADEGVWRLSSAYWGAGRLGLMRSAFGRPGFDENWLNAWPGVGQLAAGMVDRQVWAAAAVPGLVIPAARRVVAVGLDVDAMSWHVTVAGMVDADRVGVAVVGVAGNREEAIRLASAAVAAGGGVLVIPRPLRGHVRVPGARQTIHLSDGDVGAALQMVGFWLPAGLLLHDPDDSAITDEVLAIPAKRKWGSFDAGVLALCAAWWAGRERSSAVVV